MLRLYFAPGSCARASHIALAEAGARYEAVRISLAGGDQHKPEFLALNPKGRVPALVTEQGVLTETPAILAWVAQTYPQARLAPAEPFDFARMQAFNSYLVSTVHVARAHKYRGYRWADEPASLADMAHKAPETVAACFQLIEDELLTGPWVTGEQYTVADGYLFTLADWLEIDGVDPARFPRVLDHRERVRSRPAVRRVLAEEAA